MTQTLGNRQRWSMGGWIMAGLMVIGFNGFHLFSLQNTPLEADTATINGMRFKLARLDLMLSDQRVEVRPALGNEVWHPPRAATPPVDARPPALDPPERPPTPAIQIQLPRLTGIAQVTPASQPPYFLAVVDGRVVREKDRLKEFAVVGISATGIVLSGHGRQWFIESPTLYYSQEKGQ